MFEEEPFYREQFAEVYDPQLQIRLLDEHFPGVNWKSKFVSVPHHLAHAASAFYQSGFDEALVMVSDGMGEVDSMTIYTVIGNKFDLAGEGAGVSLPGRPIQRIHPVLGVRLQYG